MITVLIGAVRSLLAPWRASGHACDVARDHGHTGGQW